MEVVDQLIIEEILKFLCNRDIESWTRNEKSRSSQLKDKRYEESNIEYKTLNKIDLGDNLFDKIEYIVRKKEKSFWRGSAPHNHMILYELERRAFPFNYPKVFVEVFSCQEVNELY